MNAVEVVNAYKSLTFVERAFRNSVLPEPLNEDVLGRALEACYEFGVTEL